jgi:peptide/nickel transport system substrate-binding protein
MRRLLAAGLIASAVLVGCGDSDGADDAATSGGGTDSDASTSTGAASGGSDTTGDVSATTGVQAGGEAVIVTGNEPTTLDPQVSEDYAARVTNLNVYETLLERDENGELQPLLAAEMPTPVDGTTWEFKLRDGITFHEGQPFDAESVAYSVNRIIDPELQSEQVSFFETIVGATAIDDTTVHIETSGPDPLLPTRMYWMTMVPNGAGDDPAFADNPNGTGPFRFVEWNRGQSVVLERNPDYWGEPAALDRVVVRAIPDPGAQVAAMQAGEVDLLLQISPEQAQQVPVVKSVQGTESPILRLDSRDGVLADARVRQALNYAVDRETLAETLFEGFAEPSDCQIMTPAIFGYNPELESYPYDPERARQLIQEAGVEGETLQLTGLSGRFVRDREMNEALVQYFEDVGLDVELQFPDIAVYLDHLFVKDQFPAMLYISSSNELFDADKQMTYLASDGPGSGFSNPEVDRLAAEARTELDVPTREQMYHDLNAIACDEAANVFLMYTQDIYGMSDDLQWEPRPDGLILAKAMSTTGG